MPDVTDEIEFALVVPAVDLLVPEDVQDQLRPEIAAGQERVHIGLMPGRQLEENGAADVREGFQGYEASQHVPAHFAPVDLSVDDQLVRLELVEKELLGRISLLLQEVDERLRVRRDGCYGLDPVEIPVSLRQIQRQQAVDFALGEGHSLAAVHPLAFFYPGVSEEIPVHCVFRDDGSHGVPVGNLLQDPFLKQLILVI